MSHRSAPAKPAAGRLQRASGATIRSRRVTTRRAPQHDTTRTQHFMPSVAHSQRLPLGFSSATSALSSANCCSATLRRSSSLIAGHLQRDRSACLRKQVAAPKSLAKPAAGRLQRDSSRTRCMACAKDTRKACRWAPAARLSHARHEARPLAARRPGRASLMSSFSPTKPARKACRWASAARPSLYSVCASKEVPQSLPAARRFGR